MVEMLGEFRAAMRGGPPPRVTAADAEAALRVALAAADDAAAETEGAGERASAHRIGP
jgi:hypothetical protein